MPAHTRILCALFTVALALPVTGCKSRQSMSRGKWLDNGTLVLESGTYMPGVFPILDERDEIVCTATAVSDNTLITAAHCAWKFLGSDEEEATKAQGEKWALLQKGPLCVQLIDEKKVCTPDVFIPAAKNFEFDVAVAVFPRGTFSYFHNLTVADAPATGNDVLLVGFSQDLLFSEEFPKRWGRNKVTARDQDRPASEIFSLLTGDDVVAVSPGDSGGPLLDTACRLRGVASRMQQSRTKRSIHVGFHTPGLTRFLEEARQKAQARYCGHGEVCDGNKGLVAQVNVQNALHFPCRAPGEENDPAVLEAIARLQSRRDKNREGLSSRPISCLNGEEVRRRGGTGGACLEYGWVETANNSQACDAAFVSLSGEKFISREELPQGGQGEAVINNPGSADLAMEKLRTEIKASSKQIMQSLVCSSRGRGSCCLRPVCKKIIPAAKNIPPAVGDAVSCDGSMVSIEQGARWLETNLTNMNPGIAPRIEDLEREAFPCAMTESMVLRKTRGVCYEWDEPNIAVSAGDRDKPLFKCWAVRGGKMVTPNQAVSCPASLKASLFGPGGE